MDQFEAPPLNSPLYTFEPGEKLSFPHAQVAMVMYGVDQERVAHLVPAACEVPKTPKVICCAARYDKSPVGPYLEAATLVEAAVPSKRTRVTGWFAVSAYVTSDAAMAMGREVFGFPRKLAEIELFDEGEVKVGRVRRADSVVMEIRVEPDWQVEELPGGDVVRVLNLKRVPAPDLSGKAATQITSAGIAIPVPGSIMVGTARIKLGNKRTDPLGALRPRKSAGAVMGAVVESAFELCPGKVVRRL